MDDLTTHAGLHDSASWQPLDGDDPDRHFDSKIGPMWVRSRGAGRAEARFEPGAGCANWGGNLHGAYLAGIAEKCLFLPLFLDGRVERTGVVTVDFAVQFVAGGICGKTIDVEIETLRETGRMGFMRGMIRQDGAAVAGFTGVMRKIRTR